MSNLDELLQNEIEKPRAQIGVTNEDGSVTVKLFMPIQYGKEELITEIRLIRPKAKHLKNIRLKDMGFGDIMNLLSKLSGHAPSVLDELDMVDFNQLGGVIEGFLDNSGTSGKTP